MGAGQVWAGPEVGTLASAWTRGGDPVILRLLSAFFSLWQSEDLTDEFGVDPLLSGPRHAA